MYKRGIGIGSGGGDHRHNTTHGTSTSNKFNDILTQFDPSAESKLMADQIANLRHIGGGGGSSGHNNNISLANIANSTALSSSHAKPPFQPLLSADTNLFANTSKLASANANANNAGGGGGKSSLSSINHLAVSSSNVSASNHQIDDSISNVSLAFNAYRPNRPVSQSSICCLILF